MSEGMAGMVGDVRHARGLTAIRLSTVTLLSLLARALGEPMRSRKLKTASVPDIRSC